MNSHPAKSTATDRHMLTRRQVLVIGSLAAARPLLPHTAWADEILYSSVMLRAQPMQVGYLQHSESIASLSRLPSTLEALTVATATADNARLRMVPAESIAGEPSIWEGPVRVGIHGSYHALDADRHGDLGAFPLAADLDVQMTSHDGAENNGPLLFHAWTYRGRGPNSSPPTSFVLPAHSRLRIEFRLTMHEADGSSRSFQIPFVPGDVKGQPHLRRGLYVLSPSPAIGIPNGGFSGSMRANSRKPFAILISFAPEAETLASS